MLFMCLTVLVICPVVVVSEDDTRKRILLNSDDDIAAVIQTMSQKIEDQQRITEELQAKTSSSGSTYVRWGRTSCPDNGGHLVHTAGGHYTHSGSPADFICLTDEPLWDVYDDGYQQYTNRIYGVEYQSGVYANNAAEFFGQDLFDHDVPCVLCYSNRTAVVMIPGRNQCYDGWTMEYAGYLVGGRYDYAAASNYACLDRRAETEFGDVEDKDGKRLYLTEAVCGSLKCPPYVENREVTCVVCSK